MVVEVLTFVKLVFFRYKGIKWSDHLGDKILHEKFNEEARVVWKRLATHNWICNKYVYLKKNKGGFLLLCNLASDLFELMCISMPFLSAERFALIWKKKFNSFPVFHTKKSLFSVFHNKLQTLAVNHNWDITRVSYIRSRRCSSQKNDVLYWRYQFFHTI